MPPCGRVHPSTTTATRAIIVNLSIQIALAPASKANTVALAAREASAAVEPRAALLRSPLTSPAFPRSLQLRPSVNRPSKQFYLSLPLPGGGLCEAVNAAANCGFPTRGWPYVCTRLTV